MTDAPEFAEENRHALVSAGQAVAGLKSFLDAVEAGTIEESALATGLVPRVQAIWQASARLGDAEAVERRSGRFARDTAAQEAAYHQAMAAARQRHETTRAEARQQLEEGGLVLLRKLLNPIVPRGTDAASIMNPDPAMGQRIRPILLQQGSVELAKIGIALAVTTAIGWFLLPGFEAGAVAGFGLTLLLLALAFLLDNRIRLAWMEIDGRFEADMAASQTEAAATRDRQTPVTAAQLRQRLDALGHAIAPHTAAIANSLGRTRAVLHAWEGAHAHVALPLAARAAMPAAAGPPPERIRIGVIRLRPPAIQAAAG